MDRPQDPTEPRVTVVIPCRNEEKTIAAVLDAVDAQDFTPHEVIVVDDASTDSTRAVIASWAAARPRSSVRVVDGPGRGPAAAMNAGVLSATGDVILRLDGHCRPRRDYIRRSVESLSEHGAGVVGGVWEIEASAPTHVARAIAAVTAHPMGSGGVAYRSSAATGTREVDTVPFGCFRRELWDSLGGYDELLVANEDYDFNHRARRAGKLVMINADIRSVYGSRPTLAALGRQYFRYGFWKVQMLRKSPGALRLRQVPPALILPWVGATLLSAIVFAELWLMVMAGFYPAAVAVAGVQIAMLRRDAWLVAPALAAIIVQHAAWSAGFWHGLLWPPPQRAV